MGILLRTPVNGAVQLSYDVRAFEQRIGSRGRLGAFDRWERGERMTVVESFKRYMAPLPRSLEPIRGPRAYDAAQVVAERLAAVPGDHAGQGVCDRIGDENARLVDAHGIARPGEHSRSSAGVLEDPPTCLGVGPHAREFGEHGCIDGDGLNLSARHDLRLSMACGTGRG